MTNWTLLLRAQDHDHPQSEAALAKLCEIYWYPLYAYVRRSGCSPEDAEDVTQSFFLKLIEKHYLDRVDKAKGHLRSYLLGAMKHHLSHCRAHERALKRGGGVIQFSIDQQSAENRYRYEPVDHLSPDSVFEKQWALVTLENVRVELAKEFAAKGKQQLYENLRSRLTPADEETSYKDVAAALGMSLSAVKVASLRMRERYRDLLKREIARTVESPDMVDGEIRYLSGVLSG